MPFKVFQVNEILTAADVNDFLAEQVVATFAGTAARGSAIGTPVTGQLTYLADSGTYEFYDGSAWSQYVPPAIPGRNLFYNGAMQVAQRGTATTGITASGYYTADRWRIGLISLGTWTNTVEADGPIGSGFGKSLKWECTTAESSPAASSLIFLSQFLEGQDVQVLKKGTANAESVTISFWVKSNVIGTYVFRLFDMNNSRSINTQYSINSANTWEKKIITFSGDVSGPFNDNNIAALQPQWWLGAGSDRTSGSLSPTWADNVTANIAPGQVNVAATVGNYWQVTGVQLETGTVATAFEHKPYGVELAECQRYYYRLFPDSIGDRLGFGFSTTTNAVLMISFPTTMRTAPTSLEQSGTASDYSIARTGANVACDSVPTFNTSSVDHAGFLFSASSGLFAGEGVLGRAATTNAFLAWSAEL